MSDSEYEALTNIPGRISAFSASTKDGQVIQSTPEGSLVETEKAALAAYTILTDATILGKLTPEMQQDKLKQITVTFPSQYHAFTLSNDKIYGVERTIN